MNALPKFEVDVMPIDLPSLLFVPVISTSVHSVSPLQDSRRHLWVQSKVYLRLFSKGSV